MLRLTSAALLLALGASRLDGVSLSFRATDSTADTLNDAARAFKAKKVKVMPFTDEREDKQVIGRNTEQSTPKLVTTKDDVGAFCASQLGALLREAGVAVVETEADVVITGKVTRFLVNEQEVYRGAVAVFLTVKDAKGKELWSGLVTGEAKRWGRSYQEDNYMETLSDSLVRALDAFFTDPNLLSPGSRSATPASGTSL